MERSILEMPKGTLFYFLEKDRNGMALNIQEVFYDGYEISSRHLTCDEYGHDEWEQKTYIISFKDKKGKTFSLEFDNYNWDGIRGYNTDEHLEYGVGKSPYLDIYFTPSKERLKVFLESEKEFIKFFKENLEKLKKAEAYISEIL